MGGVRIKITNQIEPNVHAFNLFQVNYFINVGNEFDIPKEYRAKTITIWTTFKRKS